MNKTIRMAKQGESRSYFETDNTSWGSEAVSMTTKHSSAKLAAQLGFDPLAETDKAIRKKVAALTQIMSDLKTLEKTAEAKQAAPQQMMEVAQPLENQLMPQPADIISQPQGMRRE